MRVIRHDDDHAQVVSPLMIVSATIKHNLPRPIRKHATILRDEGDEVRLVIALQVRKIAPIEGHTQIVR